jgi:hypothetical protein
MQKTFVLLLTLFLLTLLSGCTASANYIKPNPTIDPEKETKQPAESNQSLEHVQDAQAVSSYLSLTATDKKGENHFYVYRFNQNSIEELAKTPDTAQYPLGAIDLKNQVLYYAERDATGSDQLVKLNLKTRQKEKLTTNIFAINYMIPLDNQVILAAALKGKRSVQLASFDLEKKTLIPWFDENDDDTCVENVTFNPFTHKLYAALYSLKERDANVHYAEKYQTGDVVPAKYQIVEYDLKHLTSKQIYSGEEMIVNFSVSKDGKWAIMRSAPMMFQDRQLYLFNMLTGKKEQLTLQGDIAGITGAFFAPDGKSLFVLGVSKAEEKFTHSLDQASPPNGLYRYDLETKTLTRVFAEPEQYINNFQLLPPQSEENTYPLPTDNHYSVSDSTSINETPQKDQMVKIQLWVYQENRTKQPQLMNELTMLPDLGAWKKVLDDVSNQETIRPNTIQDLWVIQVQYGNKQESTRFEHYAAVRSLNANSEEPVFWIKKLADDYKLPHFDQLKHSDIIDILQKIGFDRWTKVDPVLQSDLPM